MCHFSRMRILCLWAVVTVGMAWLCSQPLYVRADDSAKEDPAVKRARETVQMLDDLYKNAVVSVTDRYVDQQSEAPAAVVAKDVFTAMHKKGWHTARLLDATGKPKNKENVAVTDFEKKAVQAMKDGKIFFEEVGEKDGKRVYRAATVVPAVMKQCVVCHGKKEGALLGTITYELPLK